MDLLLVSVFIIITLMLGIYAGSLVKDLKSFALAKGHFALFPLICTIVATCVGGGVIVGTAEKAFQGSLGYAIGLLGFPLQLILTGLVIAPRINKFKTALSIGDIIKTAYGKGGQVLTGLLWCCFCVGILVVQITALGNFMAQFINLGMTANLLIGAGTVILYCYFGGIRAVVLTDVLQFIILYIAIPLTFIMALVYIGGWENFFSTADSLMPLAPAVFSVTELLVLGLSFLLGDALIPPVIQRLLMAKSDVQAKRSFFLGGFITVPLCLIGGGLGIAAYAIDPSLKAGQVIPFLINTLLPVGLKSLAICGIIAVIMSSADSYLNSVAVVFVNDILVPVRAKEITPATQLKIAKLSTLAIGGIAVIFCLTPVNLLDILLFTYKFWGPIIVIPLVGLFYGRTISIPHFYWTAGLSGGIAFLWDFVGLDQFFKVDGLVPAMSVSLICFMFFLHLEKAINLLAKRPS